MTEQREQDPDPGNQVEQDPEKRQDLKMQLAGAVNQYQSTNLILWSIFSIFAAGHAVLLNGLVQSRGTDGHIEPFSGVLQSLVGMLAALAWLLLLRRTIGHLDWHQRLVTRIEGRLGVNGKLQIFPARVAADNLADDTSPLPTSWRLFSTRLFSEDPCHGYGPPAKKVMQLSTRAALAGWTAALIYFLCATFGPSFLTYLRAAAG